MPEGFAIYATGEVEKGYLEAVFEVPNSQPNMI